MFPDLVDNLALPLKTYLLGDSMLYLKDCGFS